MSTFLYRKRSAVEATLLTIVMMCVHERTEVSFDDCEVFITVAQDERCRITVKLSIQYGAPVMAVCCELQRQIAEEIAAMTPYVAETVNIVVKRLVMP
ncbi:Asp23/Gls24 family envelope stress response protein [Geobacillus jurassicus]|uniref:Asp23/Gls24 family envelope stress response protein n=1 Tax=Geobacillus jurassicus TaxID=235932 RepID=A0ABV6GSZ5_9BACL|nr:Asp23/Gls24 family envelope stress response protein [Geobacillus jurassicus]